METETQHVWQVAKEHTPEGLLMMLGAHTLDPRFEAYGGANYGGLIQGKVYSHKVREEYLKKEAAGIWKFQGNFLDVSWSFGFEVEDKETIDRLNKAIAINLETQEYKRARLSHFNCYRFKIIYYLTKKEVKEFGGDRWWLDSETNVFLPMDYTNKEYKEAYDKVAKDLADRNTRSQIKDNGEIKCVPEEIHFFGEEWGDVARDFHDEGDPLSLTRWSQVRRLIDKPDGKEYKKYTFKSTGRKILYKEDTYSNTYYDLGDPIRDGLIKEGKV